ncbi:hypothetical protein [Desulfobacula sp.]|uniref:hypothetical protein n=1 Tax=Desulfobacula sp. TaxID=2593537 RepID=UPI00262A1FA0|nr:hypothetical protein [Desulfobacula sp.]
MVGKINEIRKGEAHRKRKAQESKWPQLRTVDYRIGGGDSEKGENDFLYYIKIFSSNQSDIGLQDIHHSGDEKFRNF